MKNRKQLFLTSRLLLMIVAVALVLSMGLTACGLPSGTPDDKAPNDVALDAESVESSDEATAAQSFTSTSKVNLEETYGELLPLYETLTELDEEAFSFVVDLSGGVDLTGINGDVDLKFIVNVTADGTVELLLLDEADRLFASYKDGKLCLDGFGMDVGYYQDAIDSVLTQVFVEGVAASFDEALIALNGILSDYDSLSQLVPALLNTMELNTTGFVMAEQDGEYILNINSQTLVALATALLSDPFDELVAGLPFDGSIADLLGVENNDASDLALLIGVIDDRFFDGALQAGEAELDVSLTPTENGLDCSVALINVDDADQIYFYLELGAAVGDTILVEIPDITVTHDIQADIPIALPQSGIYLTIHTVIHTADMFAEEGNDFITATIDLNGMEDVAQLVLNDNYFYVDINGLATLANPLGGEATEYTYILPFGEDVDLCAMIAALPGLIDDALDALCIYDLFEYHQPYPNGGPSFEQGEFLSLDVFYDPETFYWGMSEEELREVLYVAVVYADRCPEEVFDYTIEAFCACPEDGYYLKLSYNGSHFEARGGAYSPNPGGDFFSLGTLDCIGYDYEEFHIDFNADDIHEGMTEAEMRSVLHAMHDQVEIYDYDIGYFYVCPCGVCHIYVSYYDPNYNDNGKYYFGECMCRLYEPFYNRSGELTYDCAEIMPPVDSDMIIGINGFFDLNDINSIRSGDYRPLFGDGNTHGKLYAYLNNTRIEIGTCNLYRFYVCPCCDTCHIRIFYNGHWGEYIGQPFGDLYPSHIGVRPTIDPDKLIGLYAEPADEYLFEGMTEQDLRNVLHVWALYRGRDPEAFFDYDVDELSIVGNSFHYSISITEEVIISGPWYELVSMSSVGFQDGGIIPDGSEFDPSMLIPFLRFEVDPEDESLNILADVISSVAAIYDVNQDVLWNAIQIESIENGKSITVCLSDTSLVEEGDLLAFVNKFFGLPVGDGFADINGQTLYYFLTEALGAETFAEVDGALQMVGGFTLEDLCTDLYLNLTGYLNNNNKLRFGFSFSGADNDPDVDETYLSIGIIEYHAVVTDSAYDAALTAEELETANPLDEIVDVLFGCFAGLMNMGGDLD